MKFMKLGTYPDNFYTEEATRTVLSDVPTDLTIQINNITFLLHKYTLVPKCGLLQRVFSEKDDSGNATLDLNDVPGGEEAFELCAKFCYGITISLSAHNFVSAFCAAKFLRMTESVENGNLLTKLEAFFSSCILQGWKDSVVTLHTTERVYEWSENLGIVRRCIESIVDKILTPPAKVTWSYTYTRPGYEKKRHPKDWWTEDISCLGIDMFRCIVTTINSSNKVSPRLMGEALHVYASTWLLLNGSSSSQRRILDTVVSLIPADKGSVSVKFLLRLLSLSTSVGVSPVTKAQLLRFSALQLEEATLDDLLFPVQSGNDCRTSYDVDLVRTVLHSFMRRWKRQTGERQSLVKVGKIVDSYLQVVAKDANMTIKKMISLIESLPGIARPQHDNLYKAINIYLKEHPEVSKEDKKELCKYLDCQKMSAEVRSHAVKNERLPLRTVVQALFFEQEKSCSASAEQIGTPVVREQLSSKLKLNVEERSSEAKGTTPFARGTSRIRQHSRRFDDKQQLRPEPSFTIRPQMENGGEIKQDGTQLSTHGTTQARRVSEKTLGKGGER